MIQSRRKVPIRERDLFTDILSDDGSSSDESITSAILYKPGRYGASSATLNGSGSITMKSHVDEDTDDDYLDDPIKLFDFEHDRVHFGTQLQREGNTSNIENCQSQEDGLSSDTELEDVTECIPLHVKLVDCKKFPWYYKKYGQQILDQTIVYDLVSDSENDADVECVSDNNDCFILNDIAEKREENNFDVIKDNSLSTVPKVIQTRTEKRQATMKRRENFELLAALQRKNVDVIDFKRNTGLIGMTIKQKIVKNVGHKIIRRTVKAKEKRVKKNKTCFDSQYLRAADKTLSIVGTELIPISNEIVNTTLSNTEPDVNNKVDNKKVPVQFRSNNPLSIPISNEVEKTTSSITEPDVQNKVDNKKIPVQFSLGKISKNLLSRIKASKTVDNHNICKNNCNIINGQKPDLGINTSHKISSSSDQAKNSSNHVKNIKKTVKYKNDQFKAIEKMVMENQDSEIEKLHDKNDTKKVNATAGQSQSPRNIAKEILEPNSPILPCTSLIKKNRDLSEASKSDQVNNTSLLRHAANNTKTSTVLNVNEDTRKQLKEAETGIQNIGNSTTIKTQHDIKENSQKNKISECESKIEESSNKNNNNCDSIAVTQTNVSDVNNLKPTSQKELDSNPISVISIQTMSNVNKSVTNTSQANSNKHILPSNFDVSQNKSITVTSDANKIKQIDSNSKQDSCMRNVTVDNIDNRVALKNVNNANAQINNHYASAIILRSNQSSYSQVPVGCNAPNFERPRIPTPNPSSYYRYPYLTNLHVPPPPLLHPYCLEHRFRPRSANCGVPNFRFPPPNVPRPYDNRYQTPYNPSHSHPLNNNARPNTPKKTIKGTLSRKIFPCRLPAAKPQTSHETISAVFGVLSQQKSTPTPKTVSQSNNTGSNSHTVITKDTDTVVKKNRIDIPVTQYSTGTGQVSTLNSNKGIKESNSNLIEIKTQQIEQIGYSPPILPIPTYEKLMSQGKSLGPSTIVVNKDRNAPSTNKHQGSSIKRVCNNSSHDSARKEDLRKISLEEYKQRTFNMGNRVEDSNKRANRNFKGNDKRQKVHDREHVDHFSTETDLGYDSDSTVIL